MDLVRVLITVILGEELETRDAAGEGLIMQACSRIPSSADRNRHYYRQDWVE